MKTPEPYKTRHERGIEAIYKIIDDASTSAPQKVDRITRVIVEVEHTEQDIPLETRARMEEIGYISDRDETIVNGRCVGYCKVVDVAVATKLREKLDECKEQVDRLNRLVSIRDQLIEVGQRQLVEWRDHIQKQATSREYLIDAYQNTVKNRETTIDEYRETVENRDKTIALRGDVIKKQRETLNCANKVILDFKTIETKEIDRLQKIIDELKAKNIDDLKELHYLDLREITSVKSDRDIMFQNYRNTISKLRHDIKTLEAELFARKDDSGVLLEVVEIVESWNEGYCGKYMQQIATAVEDYLDGTTHISDYNNVTGTSTKGNESENTVKTNVVEIEYPVDRSRTVHLQKMRIAEQSETIKRLVKEAEELRDANQITVNVPTTEHVQPVIDEIMRGIEQQSYKIKVGFVVPDGVYLELP